MVRVLGWLCLPVLVAGCQAQNPYAPFGPPTVPAPAANQLPYYPPGGVSQAAQPAATNTRPSVSVSGPSGSAPRGSITTDAADREPIRIVENAAPTRTADSGRGKSQPPAALQPIAPPRNLPSAPVNPPRNASGQNARLDSAVKPANYDAVAPSGFREAAPATGQWRAR
jgi:hypothetical protein